MTHWLLHIGLISKYLVQPVGGKEPFRVEGIDIGPGSHLPYVVGSVQHAQDVGVKVGDDTLSGQGTQEVG